MLATDSLTRFSSTIGDVIAIPEEDAVYVFGDEYKVIGKRPYFTFVDGKRNKHEIDDTNNS